MLFITPTTTYNLVTFAVSSKLIIGDLQIMFKDLSFFNSTFDTNNCIRYSTLFIIKLIVYRQNIEYNLIFSALHRKRN